MKISEAINTWADKSQAGALNWKKSYLSFDMKKKDWNVIELNVLQRFFRMMFGAYKTTHCSCIKEKISKCAPQQCTKIDASAQERFREICAKMDIKCPLNKVMMPLDPRKLKFHKTDRTQAVAPCYVGEKLSDTDAVFKRTGQPIVNEIYQALENLDGALRDADIKYCLCGGTQLGATRQTGVDKKGPGGLIPWDDDGDIAILKDDLPQLIALKDVFDRRGYELVEHEYSWKLQPKDGIPFDPKDEIGKNGETIKFPFIDIFVMSKRDDGDSDKYYIANDEAFKMWDYEYYSDEEWDNITDIQFGHLKLRGLTGKHADAYLDRGYCDKYTKEPTWRDEAARWWDHEEAKRDEIGTPSWTNIRSLKLVDRTHATVRPVIDHQQVAKTHLDTMSDEQLDADWKLSDFFGHVRILNLDINPDRLKQARKELRDIGAKDDFSERFRGILGREELPETLWDRVDSNYKHYDVKDPKQAAQLKRQHAGQAGCFMGHYNIVKDTREQYHRALREYEHAQYELRYNKKKPQSELQKNVESACAKVKKYSTVLILEDDNGFGILDQTDATVASYGSSSTQIKVTGKHVTKEGTGQILRQAIRDMPQSWNMLYFLAMDYKGGKKVEGSKNLLQLQQGVLNNCYAVNANFYDTFVQNVGVIEEDSEETFKAFDEQLAQLHPTSKTFVIQPALATQDGGGSDINQVDDDGTRWQCHV